MLYRGSAVKAWEKSLNRDVDGDTNALQGRTRTDSGCCSYVLENHLSRDQTASVDFNKNRPQIRSTSFPVTSRTVVAVRRFPNATTMYFGR